VRDRSYDTSNVTNTTNREGDTGTELLSREAGLPSQSVGHDREPSADGHSKVATHNGHEKRVPSSQTRVRPRSVSCDRESSRSSRSRAQTETDDENVVPSRSAVCNRGPSANSHSEVTGHSGVEMKIPSSQVRVHSRSVSHERGLSADHSARVPSVSNGDNTAYSHRERRLNPRCRNRSENSEGDRISTEAEGHRQLSVSENADESVTGTSVWSDESPQHSVHGQSALQLSQVYIDFLYLSLLYPPSEWSEWGIYCESVMLDSVCHQSINRLRRHRLIAAPRR